MDVRAQSDSSPFVPFCIPPAAEICSSNLQRYESSFLLSFVVNTVLLVFKVASHKYCIVLISAYHPALAFNLTAISFAMHFKSIHCEDGSPTTAATSSAANVTSEAIADYY